MRILTIVLISIMSSCASAQVVMPQFNKKEDQAPGKILPWSCATIESASIVSGSGYQPGTYLALPLKGGSGLGAIADITVIPGGSVGNVAINQPGMGYKKGDQLSADLPRGKGFSLMVLDIIDRHPAQLDHQGKDLFKRAGNSNPCQTVTEP